VDHRAIGTPFGSAALTIAGGTSRPRMP